MRMPGSPIRSSSHYSCKARILAALVTAILPATAAALFLWLVPSACELQKVKAIYRWTCLLPGLLIIVPAVIGTLLSAFGYLIQRSSRRFPDGWLGLTVASGLITQLVLIGAYLLALEPAYRGIMLGELLTIPQPFVAGAVSGAVFWVALQLGTRFAGARAGRPDAQGDDPANR